MNEKWCMEEMGGLIKKQHLRSLSDIDDLRDIQAKANKRIDRILD